MDRWFGPQSLLRLGARRTVVTFNIVDKLSGLLGELMNSCGIAIADVDGDGKLDFALANQWGPSFFFHNTAPNAGEFLGLHLRLPVGSSADEATVRWEGAPQAQSEAVASSHRAPRHTVHLPDGRRLVAQVDGGTGHSRKPLAGYLHFGLGQVDASAEYPGRSGARGRGSERSASARRRCISNRAGTRCSSAKRARK